MAGSSWRRSQQNEDRAARADLPGVEREAPAEETVEQEIDRLLVTTKGQIGLVAACLQRGITDRSQMVEEGAAANNGAVGNLLLNIRAIRDGEAPPRPSNARLALGAARSFLKQHRFKLSPATTDHVENVIETLEAVVQSPGAQEQEEEELQSKSAELEEVLESSGGVYAYTYPHYWRHPTVEGTRRTLLKVGMTTRDAKVRIHEQARGTGIPEQPLVVRVYYGDEDLRVVKRKFHALLTAADHTRPDGAASGGREWFETSVEFLDTIASVLRLQTLQAEEPQ